MGVSCFVTAFMTYFQQLRHFTLMIVLYMIIFTAGIMVGMAKLEGYENDDDKF